jgi:hypothetical protein
MARLCPSCGAIYVHRTDSECWWGWWANRPTTRRVRCSVLLARLLSDAEIATLFVLITRTGEAVGEQRVQVGRRLRAGAAPGRRSRCADAL